MSDRDIVVTIYHNPNCGTSRNTLALIRNAGVEPTVIEYLKTPPDRATLESLIQRMGIRVRDLIRQKGTPYGELALEEPSAALATSVSGSGGVGTWSIRRSGAKKTPHMNATMSVTMPPPTIDAVVPRS